MEQDAAQPAQEGKLPKLLTTATSFTKILAMFLFIFLPFVGFYLGMQYQQGIMINPPVSYVQKISPTPTMIPIDTSSWKTYTNNTAGYVIKYPAEYKLQEGISYTGVDGVSAKNPNTTSIINDLQMTISYKETREVTVNNYIKNNSQCSSIKADDGKPYLIGGVNGLIYEQTPCGVGGTTEIYVINKGYLFQIVIDERGYYYPEAEKELLKTLSTFQFAK